MLLTISSDKLSEELFKKNGSLISRAIVREQLRRCWPVALLMFLTFFVFGILYSILRSDSSPLISIGVNAFIGMIISIAAGIAVFRFLHSPSALSVIHAFPVSRAKLFFSSFISGLILIFVPFFISAIALWLTSPYTGGWGQWLVSCVIIFFYSYAVTVLAAMVSGNLASHILTAAIFNFAWLLLGTLIVMHISESLFGVVLFENSYASGMYLNPFSCFAYIDLMGPSELSTYVDSRIVDPALNMSLVIGWIMYAILSIAVVTLSYVGYKRLRAERAGESVTARPVEYLFVYAVSLVGMFIGGLIFSVLNPMGGFLNATSSGTPATEGIDPMNYVNPFYVVGAVIGAIVAFILATMLVKKSVRVFNISSLRRFGIFAVAVAIFFVCTMTNITGAETRVPAPAEVQTAALSIHAFTVPPYKYSVLDWTTDNIPIRGESDIAALCELHRNALKENAYRIDNSGLSIMAEDGNVEIDTETGISYALKNGGRELRSYMLPSKYLTGSEAYARLLASDSVKKQMNIGRLIGYGNLDLPELSHQNGSSTADLDTDIREKFGYGDVADLAALLDEDFEAMDAEDMLNPGKELFTLRLSSSNLKEKTEGLVYGSVSAALSGNGKILSKYIEDNEYEDPSIFTLYYTVTDKNVKAIEWLKSKGIYDSIMKSAAEMESRAAQDEFNPDTGTYE